MPYLIIPLSILLGAAVLIAAISVGCFFKVFYSFRGRKKSTEEYPIPPGRIYLPYREQMIEWMKETRARAYTELSVTSFDGLRLYGKYFECQKGATVEILFHGYRGSAERDLCGGVARCFALGHNALIVDQRASGKSEGRVITFGAKESRDCLAWIELVRTVIDKDARIILTGISMGAATVMAATALPLPENVIGVLADCGYTSTKDIIKKVARDMKLPPSLLYPFVRLGARVLGGFDPDKESPLRAMRDCRLPVIFFHGDTDDFVPASMSEENYAACAAARKRLVLVKGAGHGLCFPADQALYLAELRAFFPEEG